MPVKYELTPDCRLQLDADGNYELTALSSKHGVRLAGDDAELVLDVLCSEPIDYEGSISRLAAALDDEDASTARHIIDECIATGLLVEADQVDVARVAGAAWDSAGWSSARPLHIEAYDYPFVDYSELSGWQQDVGRMHDYLLTDPVPPVYKDVSTRTSMTLARDADRTDGIEKRLGAFLFSVFGQVATRHWPPQGDFVQRTSPSGGSRHPTEAYVAFHAAGSQSGWHYSVRKHSLDYLVGDANVAALLANATVRLTVVLTSIVNRSMWRYRDPRSARVILIDAGHLVETMRLVSPAYGCSVGRVEAARVSSLDPYLSTDELPLLAADVTIR